MSKREDHQQTKNWHLADSGHADFLLQVEVEFIGERDPDDDPDCYRNERHALIYTDGSVAVTLYECCYALWHLNDGIVAGGSLWAKGDYRLVEGAVEAIRAAETPPKHRPFDPPFPTAIGNLLAHVGCDGQDGPEPCAANDGESAHTCRSGRAAAEWEKLLADLRESDDYIKVIDRAFSDLCEYQRGCVAEADKLRARAEAYRTAAIRLKRRNYYLQYEECVDDMLRAAQVRDFALQDAADLRATLWTMVAHLMEPQKMPSPTPGYDSIGAQRDREVRALFNHGRNEGRKEAATGLLELLSAPAAPGTDLVAWLRAEAEGPSPSTPPGVSARQIEDLALIDKYTRRTLSNVASAIESGEWRVGADAPTVESQAKVLTIPSPTATTTADRCDLCDPSFECWLRRVACYKVPLARPTHRLARADYVLLVDCNISWLHRLEAESGFREHITDILRASVDHEYPPEAPVPEAPT